MKRVILLILVYCAIFHGCKSGKPDTPGFDRIIELTGKLYPGDYMLKWSEMHYVDPYIIVSEAYQPNNFIHIFSPEKDMEEVYSYGRFGRGPQEFMGIPMMYSTYGNELVLENTNANNIVLLELLTDSTGKPFIREKERVDVEREKIDDIWFAPSNAIKIDDTLYVAGMFAGRDKFLGLFDKNMKILSYFGQVPVDGELEYMSYRYKLPYIIESGSHAVILVFVELGNVIYYDMEDGVPDKKWEDKITEIPYTVSNHDITVDNDRARGRIGGLKAGKKYIYLSYFDELTFAETDFNSSDKYAPKAVLVYDHEGNRIARLELDHRIHTFCVSDDEKKLYGLVPPEMVIVEYDLPSLK